MPSGQSTMIWFPAIKKILKEQWKVGSNIQEHFELIKLLNIKLVAVRKEFNVKPAMFFCKHCNARHENKFRMVTITAMYFALERFKLCTHEEYLELKRNWKKYSKQHSINIHGKPKDEDEKHKSVTG